MEDNIKELDDKVLRIIEDLQYINNEYSKNNRHDKVEILNRALSKLITGYREEIIEDIILDTQ